MSRYVHYFKGIELLLFWEIIEVYVGFRIDHTS